MCRLVLSLLDIHGVETDKMLQTFKAQKRLKQNRDGIKRIPRPLFLCAGTLNHLFTNFLVSNQLELTQGVFGILLSVSALVD